MALTQAQLDTFHRDGFLIVEGVFDKKDVEAARVEMEQIFHGTSVDEYLAKLEATGEAESTEPTRTTAVARYGETNHPARRSTSTVM